MDISKLQLYNWVYVDNEDIKGVYKVTDISDSNEVFISEISSWISADEIYPIKLSDEFLLKNFDNNDDEKFYFKIFEEPEIEVEKEADDDNIYNISVFIFKDKKYKDPDRWKLLISDVDDTVSSVPIKYVHELQNEVKYIVNIDLKLKISENK